MKTLVTFLLFVFLAATASAQVSPFNPNGNTATCPAGSKFSDTLHRCVKIGGPEDPIECGLGFTPEYGKASGWTCVVAKPADPDKWIPVNGQYWDNLYRWLTGPLGVTWYIKQLNNADVACTREQHSLLWGIDRNTGLNYYETFDCGTVAVVADAGFGARFSALFGGTPIAAPPQLYRISNGNPYRGAEFLSFWLGVGPRPKEGK